ncbi:LacI family DNA-binding transcriptional regulator [Alicyclobacillus tolerans]|uniref:Transcriptional regulator, LacI family n=2 Tax=Alicyclobacillus tolerans TaxID=90970 RepID=A0A1M6QLK6_9BACL|nr:MULTISPECIES: LacI family DNA-binding transcriptional regulator [Alicyclobacillus]MDP9729545.1 LacI family transcriptional regulator [Alicyclobacillus tengchongensis]QRF22763.1 LacI family transcriptional regulator [Alicyclobacillus sp. TC]SHK20897.1 transcriptional regulator, LacI family [Alicyclobacillus montanus]
MTTIYDIAKRAGVSPTTVSKVLNGYPDVSLKTRGKVQRIMSELGYQPSAAARSLATNRSMTVGVFFQDHVNSGLRHPFLHDVLASFKDVVGGKGYDLLLFSDAERENFPSGFEARAKHRDVDGLLLVGVPRTDPGLVALARSRIPVVSIDLDLIGSRASYLMSDNLGGTRAAMSFLLNNGHRKIAFIGDRLGTKPGHDRMLGYQQSLQELDLPFRSEWMLDGDFTEVSGYEAMKKLLQVSELPTAVFCASDMMAIGAFRALQEVGKKPGQDISVMGFDDIELARYVTPSLTTVRQNKEEMGRLAAFELLELMAREDKPPTVITVDTEIVVRESVCSIS